MLCIHLRYFPPQVPSLSSVSFHMSMHSPFLINFHLKGPVRIIFRDKLLIIYIYIYIYIYILILTVTIVLQNILFFSLHFYIVSVESK